MYKTRPGPEFPLFFWPGPVRPGPVSDFVWPGPVRPGPVRAPCDYCTVLYSTVQYCTGQYSSKTQKKLEFQTIFEKVTLEPLKKIGDLYQSMHLEKSVSKMGLRHLRCGTNDHLIKKHWIFRRETRLSRVRIFRNFENLDFWKFDPMILCSFLATIRWATLENYSSKQMMVYDQITFFII